MEFKDILDILPHRYPFLLIDRVLELDPGKSVVALKNVTANEPFFQGHFPGQPVMPGVLIVEAMAQAAAIMYDGDKRISDGLRLLVGIDKARFKRQVVPGDQLILKASSEQIKRNLGVCSVQAFVDDTQAAGAQLRVVALQEESS